MYSGENSAQEPGDVVENRDGHHDQQHGNTATLESFHPRVGHTLAGHARPKIIQQVPPVEDGQRQQIQDPETNADQGQERELLCQPHAGRFAGIVSNGQRAA